MMQKDQKQQICDQRLSVCDQKGSQNKAANSMNGVSSATISKILAGSWETISDEMWRTVAAQTGGKVEGWQVVSTQAYDRMTFTLTNAQADALVLAVTGEAGSGKPLRTMQPDTPTPTT